MKKLKLIPKFKNEDEEREFWSSHDSTEYVDWSKAVKNIVFPNLKPTIKPISIRPSDELKKKAHIKLIKQGLFNA